MSKSARMIMIAIALAFTAIRPSHGESLALHPVPWEFASDRYGVTVNGKPVTVMLAAMNLHVARFDFTGQADVQVTINPNDYNRRDGKTYLKPEEFWQASAVVRPLSRGIRPKTDGRKVLFSITKPGQYSIERPGTGHFEDEVLFLFANPPEKNVPHRDDPHVIWLGPGIHQRSVDLGSGQTLYLAPGAVLYGAVNIWDAQHVRICGRGTVVYAGPNSRNVDNGWINRRNWHPLTTHNVQGLTVEGVTFVNRSRTWSIQLWKTTDAVFDNIKVIASLPDNLNCDGIDWYDGGKAVVRDSFFRTADDCFAFYAAASSEAFRTDRGGGGHLPGAKTVTPETSGEVSDIAIERCVLWPTVANIIRAGWLNQSLTTRNVQLRDCDVIHMGNQTSPWMGADWGLFSAISANGKGDCRHSNYLFENIRIEECATLLGVNWTQAQLRGFCFHDIQFVNGVRKNYLRASADGILIENVRVNGRAAENGADLNLVIEGDVKNVIIRPQSKP